MPLLCGSSALRLSFRRLKISINQFELIPKLPLALARAPYSHPAESLVYIESRVGNGAEPSGVA